MPRRKKRRSNPDAYVRTQSGDYAPVYNSELDSAIRHFRTAEEQLRSRSDSSDTNRLTTVYTPTDRPRLTSVIPQDAQLDVYPPRPQRQLYLPPGWSAACYRPKPSARQHNLPAPASNSLARNRVPQPGTHFRTSSRTLDSDDAGPHFPDSETEDSYTWSRPANPSSRNPLARKRFSHTTVAATNLTLARRLGQQEHALLP